MKFFIALACIIGAITPLPQDESNALNERITIGAIVNAINDLSQAIKDRGLDPLVIKREAREYALPVPIIFNAAGFVEDILSTGLSDIRIHRMNLGLITLRLDFDLELPHIHISAADAFGQVTIFGEFINGDIAGSVDINSIRVVGSAQVNIGIISGISVRNLNINLTLNSIDSNLRVNLLGYALTDYVNTFIGGTIPDTLLEFRSEINQLLEIVLLEIINENL